MQAQPRQAPAEPHRRPAEATYGVVLLGARSPQPAAVHLRRRLLGQRSFRTRPAGRAGRDVRRTAAARHPHGRRRRTLPLTGGLRSRDDRLPRDQHRPAHDRHRLRPVAASGFPSVPAPTRRPCARRCAYEIINNGDWADEEFLRHLLRGLRRGRPCPRSATGKQRLLQGLHHWATAPTGTPRRRRPGPRAITLIPEQAHRRPGPRDARSDALLHLPGLRPAASRQRRDRRPAPSCVLPQLARPDRHSPAPTAARREDRHAPWAWAMHPPWARTRSRRTSPTVRMARRHPAARL